MELYNQEMRLMAYKLMKYINLTGIALHTQDMPQIISNYTMSHNIDLQSQKDLFFEIAGIIGYLLGTYLINDTLDKKATLETLINIEEQEKSR